MISPCNDCGVPCSDPDRSVADDAWWICAGCFPIWLRCSGTRENWVAARATRRRRYGWRPHDGYRDPLAPIAVRPQPVPVPVPVQQEFSLALWALTLAAERVGVSA